MISKTTSAGNATFSLPNRSQRSRESRIQLLRFLVIGVSCVFVDLGIYRILVVQFGLRVDVAKAISYWGGVVVGFIGNKFWTFRSQQKSLREPLSYFALYCVTMVANIGCNRAVLSILGPNATGLAFLFATGVTTCLNFIGMRFLVFRRGIQSRQSTEHSRSINATAIPTGNVQRKVA
jgi:putative flippase GtrA